MYMSTQDDLMDAELKRFKTEIEESKKRAIELVPEWMRRAKELVYPEKIHLLGEFMRQGIENERPVYHVDIIINDIFEIMEAIDKGSVPPERYNELLDNQGHHSGGSASLVRSAVTRFSKEGPEFGRRTAYGELSTAEEGMLAILEAENQIYAELNKEKKSEGSTIESNLEFQQPQTNPEI